MEVSVNDNKNFVCKKDVSHVNFKGARDINLKYIYKNRMNLLPTRMQQKVKDIVEKGGDCFQSLRDLHINTYSQLSECKTLSEAQNLYPEFREVLQANAVVKHKSPNIKKVESQIPLEEFSLNLLKARWADLKTMDEIAKSYGLKDRSAIAWLSEKIQMPDLGKNYQALLKASDEKLNNDISQKVKNYHKTHYDAMLRHNNALSVQFAELNSQIAKETWNRLPHIREALSEFSSTTKGSEHFSEFWKTHPEYIKEFSEMKKEVAAEFRAKRKKDM